MGDAAIGLLTLLGLIAASLGYGLAVLRLAPHDTSARLPAALTASGGLAVLCWLGGWLVAAGVWSRGASLALVALGLVLLALFTRDGRGPRFRPARLPGLAFGLVACAALLLIGRWLGAIRFPFVNPCDDWPAYFHLPKLMLETGGLEEPFSMRRLGVLGVGPLLQTYFWPAWTTSAAAVTDATLGGLLLWGSARAAVMLREPGAARAVRVEAAGLAAIVASLSIPLANGSPALLPMGGTLALLCLTATLERGSASAPAGSASAHAGRAHAALWGALAALVVGMRTSNIAFPGMLGLAGVALALARRDGAAIRRWALAGLAFVIAIAPWSLASWLSSATPFFPVIMGNYRFPAVLSAPISLSETLAFVASCLWVNRLWFPLLVAALVGRARGWGGTAGTTAAAVVGAVAATGFALTASDNFNVYRYSAPLVGGAIAFLAALWLGGLPHRTGVDPRGLALVTLATALWVFVPVQVETHSSSDEGRGPKRFGSSPARGVERNVKAFGVAAAQALRGGLQEPTIAGEAHFTAVERLLGDEARILSAVSKPFFWRFDRQLVHTVDCPGQASPPPGMPFFQGPKALADYLLDLGYTHLAFTPPTLDRCLYSLSGWAAAKRSGVFLWQEWAPYFLDFLRNEQALAVELGTVYQSREVVVVDLRRARIH